MWLPYNNQVKVCIIANSIFFKILLCGTTNDVRPDVRTWLVQIDECLV